MLAQVVDIAKGVTTSSCSENVPSSEIVDNIICSSFDIYQSNASSASCVDDSTNCNVLRNNERYVQSDGGVVIDWSTLEITPIGDDIIAPMSQENMCRGREKERSIPFCNFVMCLVICMKVMPLL